MKARLTHSLIIFLIILLQSRFSVGQSDPVSFDFKWTSGDLIEVIANSSRSGTVLVKFEEFPQEQKKIIENYYADNLTINTSADYNLGSTIKLYIYNNTPDSNWKKIGIANKFIKFSSNKLNQAFLGLDTISVRDSIIIRDSITIQDSIIIRVTDTVTVRNTITLQDTINPPLYDDFYIYAMKDKNLYKMQVKSWLNDTTKRDTNCVTDIVSVLRVLRYRFNNQIFTYLENQEQKIIEVISRTYSDTILPSSLLKNIQDISAIDSAEITILNPPLKAEYLQIDDNKDSLTYADSIKVISLLPAKKRKFTVQFENLEYRTQETDWYEFNVNQQVASNYILLKDFNLISNGGRIKIKYRWPKETKVYETTGIVLERYYLGVEVGSVFNVSVDGSPTGKLEYFLESSSIFGQSCLGIWDGYAAIGYTSMRFPVESSGQNLPQIGNIVESQIQVACAPWQQEWEVNKFSFVGNLLLKTNNLNDTSDVSLYSGYGLGFRISIPSFNEKRPKEEFGRSTGLVTGFFAYDSFWNYRWRFVGEFRIDFLRIASNSVTFSLNGKLDFPIGFSGPSDIRFSILGAVNVADVSGLLSSK